MSRKLNGVLMCILVAFASASILEGCTCSTENLRGISDYQKVSLEKYSEKIPKYNDSHKPATIIVKRDPGFCGSALSALISLNGLNTVDLSQGQYAEFLLDKGEYIFGVSEPKGTVIQTIGSSAIDAFREIAITAETGKTYYIRVYGEWGTGMHIGRSSY